jgi:hypothetical protein
VAKSSFFIPAGWIPNLRAAALSNRLLRLNGD